VSEFLISFDPPLPDSKAVAPPATLKGVDVEAVSAGYPYEHDVIYTVAGKSFSYYPSSILTVLNDIHLEWMLIQGRNSHDVTLAGYTVLEAAFEQGGFQFREPAWPPTPLDGIFDAAYLEERFEAAVARVWGVIQSLQSPATP
jgi:hypothetical protein